MKRGLKPSAPVVVAVVAVMVAAVAATVAVAADAVVTAAVVGAIAATVVIAVIAGKLIYPSDDAIGRRVSLLRSVVFSPADALLLPRSPMR